METKEWTEEVYRVAKALGLSDDLRIELLFWSIEMAYDQLDDARERTFKEA